MKNVNFVFHDGIIILNFGMHGYFSSLSDFPVQTSMSQRWKLLDTEKSIASRECWKKNSRQQNVTTPVCQPGVPSMMRCFVNGTTQKKTASAIFTWHSKLNYI
jgi:hypothetical protein